MSPSAGVVDLARGTTRGTPETLAGLSTGPVGRAACGSEGVLPEWRVAMRSATAWRTVQAGPATLPCNKARCRLAPLVASRRAAG